ENAQGAALDYLSFKLNTKALDNLPEPRPAHEIFVYSPCVEGVHLRNGEFSRGGLRWSDRHEDYRTEVLGLVKAQSVKNAVIVPTGAKGCFVVKRNTDSREAFLAEGIKCYRIFIQGLLDLTDNLVTGGQVSPKNVVCYDEKDSYLVVAADKGTATFSDTANEIAEDYGFWLGDAFASGGSNGYDHKAMGITAKGAWISVQRHFLEKGIDVQKDAVSVVGIGDMSGDVFGNGLLSSNALELVAAFNHQHIFIDPNPEAASGFKERERLYGLPGSSWTDYDATLISEGGGVFSRLKKSIPISRQMRDRFALTAKKLSPDDLIKEILKAPVGLIWNGGIGTYVKSTYELDLDVGDRANDSLRINACDLGCSVFGEGGNLGMTQKARIEFALKGGAVNTDFIDNSAGVDCSDHEVNIKILLNGMVEEGLLGKQERNQLLVNMTEEVSDLVLHSNYRQGQALSLAQRHSETRYTEYLRLIHMLEQEAQLSRELEDIPSDEVLLERKLEGLGLTRPELAVLLCYAKLHIKMQMLDSDIDQYSGLKRALQIEFPPSIRDSHAEQISAHPLRREIVATQIANDLVHHMGISFVSHMKEFVGGSCMDVVKAYDITVSVFRIRESWHAVEMLPGLDENFKLKLISEFVTLGRRSTRWFLRHHRSELEADTLIEHCRDLLDKLRAHQSTLRSADNYANWQVSVQEAIDAGVPESLAKTCVDAAMAATGLPIIDAAQNAGVEVELAAAVYARLGDILCFDLFGEQVTQSETANHWQSMEKSSLLDDLSAYQSFLTTQLLNQMDESEAVDDAIQRWLDANVDFIQACTQVMDQARHAPEQEFALYSMTSRKLSDLRRMVV
ncbi:MAG: NAD-glutamate dehydrogenase, partial [Pseudomonadales bacterium]|nr:NAD-glutamate dehydrogenase [Pseudomonadales bacterium]